MRRIASLILTVILLIALCLPVWGTENERIIPVRTTTVPPGITDYASEVFSSLHRYDLEALGLRGWRLEDLSLSPGVAVANANTQEYISGVWCFPIKAMGKFSAVMFIIDCEDGTGFQIMQSELADDLNSLKSGTECKIYLSGDKIYAGKPERDKEGSVNLMEDIEGMPAHYEEELDHRILPISTCDIKVYDNVGTCWASAAGSIVAYSNEQLSQETVGKYRDDIVKAKYKKTNQRTGTINDICKSINSFSDLTYVKYKDRLSFENIKMLIDSNSPAVIAYTTTNAEYGHAVVLCGYSQLSENNKEEYQAYFIADPNHPDHEKIMVSVNGAYTSGMMAAVKSGYIHANYVWTDTAVSSEHIDALKPLLLRSGVLNTILVVISVMLLTALVIYALVKKPRKFGERYL